MHCQWVIINPDWKFIQKEVRKVLCHTYGHTQQWCQGAPNAQKSHLSWCKVTVYVHHIQKQRGKVIINDKLAMSRLCPGRACYLTSWRICLDVAVRVTSDYAGWLWQHWQSWSVTVSGALRRTTSSVLRVLTLDSPASGITQYVWSVAMTRAI